MPTREYFDWWDVACTSRFLSPADALDDPRLDGLPDDVPATATQQRDALALPGDVPLTRRSRQRFRPDIKRQSLGGRGRGADEEPQRPVGAIDYEEEAKYDRQEDGGVGPSGHGGEAGTQQTYDTGGGPIFGEDIPVDDAFFDGAEHDFQASFGGPGSSASAEPRDTQQFMDPSMDFIATISESQFGQVAHCAPAFNPWGTPPSWEYPVSHRGSGGSQHQSAPPQQPTTVIHLQPRRTQRQRHAPACGTSSHLQPPHQYQ
ncbi:hypothetical protein PIB30_009066 [Stylosanthes scabra]|uniref:Uncharacterized protein n=1 Tax=Stylosanthes scabra TaxID=79078 RepID=A0ABU6V3A0_9FABA|nr:hypothetical protein [Stylosanthes scabra]